MTETATIIYRIQPSHLTTSGTDFLKLKSVFFFVLSQIWNPDFKIEIQISQSNAPSVEAVKRHDWAWFHRRRGRMPPPPLSRCVNGWRENCLGKLYYRMPTVTLWMTSIPLMDGAGKRESERLLSCSQCLPSFFLVKFPSSRFQLSWRLSFCEKRQGIPKLRFPGT